MNMREWAEEEARKETERREEKQGQADREEAERRKKDDEGRMIVLQGIFEAWGIDTEVTAPIVDLGPCRVTGWIRDSGFNVERQERDTTHLMYVKWKRDPCGETCMYDKDTDKGTFAIRFLEELKQSE